MSTGKVPDYAYACLACLIVICEVPNLPSDRIRHALDMGDLAASLRSWASTLSTNKVLAGEEVSANMKKQCFRPICGHNNVLAGAMSGVRDRSVIQETERKLP